MSEEWRHRKILSTINKDLPSEAIILTLTKKIKSEVSIIKFLRIKMLPKTE